MNQVVPDPDLKPTIVYEILNERETNLLRKCADTACPDEDMIYVAPFNRVGRSGAKMLRVYFCSDRKCYPHIVKIDTAQRIRLEHSNWKSVSQYYDPSVIGHLNDPILEPDGPYAENPLGALHFRLIADNQDQFETTTQLSDFLFRDYEDLQKNAECLRNIQDLFRTLYGECLKTAINATSLDETEVSFCDEYAWHIEAAKHQSPLRVISEVTGITFDSARVGEDGAAEFEFLGKRFPNPLRLYLKLCSTNNPFRTKRKLLRVHGDLHCNNIILDSKNAPKLVDFAWAQRDGDILKDFVLMENSLRFLMFPRAVNFERQFMIDKLLLEEDGPGRALQAVESRWPLREQYLRLLHLIEILRKFARYYYGEKYCWSKYLASQFIILHRLLGYKTSNTHTGFRVLGMIAETLQHDFSEYKS